MKKHLVLFFFAAGNLVAYSQSEQWQQGAVVLSNNLVLTGELLVHLDFNTLVLKETNERLVLPASTIKSFRFYDMSNNINRQFLTLDDLQEGSTTFYELVVQGEYKIVRKQKRFHSAFPDDKEDYLYFTFNDGILTPIRNFRKKVFPQLLQSTPELTQWVNEQRLDLNSSETAILVVKEYNRVLNAKELVASR